MPVVVALLGVARTALSGPLALLLDRFPPGEATALVIATGIGHISFFYDDRQRLTMIARQGMAIDLGGCVFLMIGAGSRLQTAVILF